MARFLAEATAKRVLLNAFTRALRDQFPPARMAGLMALVATTEYYEPGESAGRVIPAVAPLLVDPEKAGRLLIGQPYSCLSIKQPHVVRLTLYCTPVAPLLSPQQIINHTKRPYTKHKTYPYGF